ncbi:MAG: C10 family peptidase, partial [Muribaculaceae bacterium]|nr:C10 family peptidase [Muribaculaceae bacterium]
MKSWIEGYCAEIEYAKSIGVSPELGTRSVETRSLHEAIAPLIKSKWDQGAPYYNDCPKIGNSHCFTGCIATSMAQVMNYFKYPDAGTGVVGVSVNGQYLRMNLADKEFDWDNMLDNYVAGTYNETQAAAVAYLMKACGFSVNMNYGLNASGSTSPLIAKAFKENFKYDPNVTFEARISYSASEWDEKVYNNIKSGSPVIYNGNDLTVGHSFICDGYDGNGYYHINWGWSGMSDGYFLLNALNPEALGTGGGEGGGYNFLQGGVFNIRKPTGAPEVQTEPTLTVYGLLGVMGVTKDYIGRSVVSIGLESGYGTLKGWRNESMNDLKLSIGGMFENVATGEVVAEQEGRLGNAYTLNLAVGTYYSGETNASVTVPADLPDGDYKLILATKNARVANAPWNPVAVPYSYPNYVLISKRGDDITATSVKNPRLEISNFEIVGNLYYGRAMNVKFIVKNPSNYELTDAISVVLKQNGEDKFKSASVLVTVEPNSESEQTWTMLMYPEKGQVAVKEDTQFDVDVIDEFSKDSYGNFGTVIMRPNPGDPTVQLRTLTVEGAESEQVQIGNSKLNVVVVENGDFDVTLKFRVTKGYFDYKVFASLSQLAPGATSPTQTVPVSDQIWSQQVELNTGEEESFTIPISYMAADPNQIYYVNCKYFGPNREVSIGSLRFKVKNGAGVEDVFDNENASPEYYNMLGVKIANPAPGELVIERKGSKITKMIYR